MTQSKKSEDTFTINLDDTYGTTTTYWAGGIMTDTVYSINDDTITISDGTFTIDTNSVDWLYNDKRIDPSEVERMCKEYPALEKTWRNFKATYDLVKQDWKGKQDDDEELPF